MGSKQIEQQEAFGPNIWPLGEMYRGYQESTESAQDALEDASPLRGIAAVIAENMEASLEVPTATSVRNIPAKLLEENRRTINRYLASTKGGKVSVTHVIGWAILKALEDRPAMKARYEKVDDKPVVVVPKHVNFGLAVDMERGGQRLLIVPNIKTADDLLCVDLGG